MRRLYPGDYTLTVFGTIPGRHNPVIADLWGRDRFLWIPTGMVVPRLGALADTPWAIEVFRRVHALFTRLFPGKTCHFSIYTLMDATPKPNWLEPGCYYEGRYESRYYHLIANEPAPALHLPAPIVATVIARLEERFSTTSRRRCAFYIRHKGLVVEEDLSSALRRSSSLDDHLPAIDVLVAAGYQVLLTGDVTAPPELVAAYGGAVVDWRASGTDRDTYMVFAGTEADIHIGNLSGGSAFLWVTDMPGLMLNAFPPGNAIPNATLHYKSVHGPDGRPVPLETQLSGLFSDIDTHGYVVETCSPQEMADVVSDFVAHCHAHRPYGVDPADLGIDAPWIKGANARLSPIWLNSLTEARN